jgi:hypothetical protein
LDPPGLERRHESERLTGAQFLAACQPEGWRNVTDGVVDSKKVQAVDDVKGLCDEFKARPIRKLGIP